MTDCFHQISCQNSLVLCNTKARLAEVEEEAQRVKLGCTLRRVPPGDETQVWGEGKQKGALVPTLFSPAPHLLISALRGMQCKDAVNDSISNYQTIVELDMCLKDQSFKIGESKINKHE